jgi:hypothetical protein
MDCIESFYFIYLSVYDLFNALSVDQTTKRRMIRHLTDNKMEKISKEAVEA